MNLIESALGRRPLILTTVVLMSLIGLAAWQGMDRQEDPFFPYRYGHVMVSWPGADPERVERLVINILEDELAKVDEVREIRATARLGFAHLIVALNRDVYDTDSVWQRIRMALDQAEHRLPDAAGPIDLRDRSMDSHGIVLAVTGSDDPLILLDAARQLRRDLFGVDGIGRIDLLGDPGEQIVISVDPARLLALGLNTQMLSERINRANQAVPGGTLIIDERNLILQPHSDLRDLDELGRLSIATPDGALLALSDIADIRLQPAEPINERIWFNAQPAVALGIIIPRDNVNAIAFGEQVRSRIEELAPRYAPLSIEEMFYQPAWVEQRLAELGRSLLYGVISVAIILLLAMGWRMGLVVAGLLPLVTFSGLAVYAMGGGVLHQMAVAGMVIALGMLVDNAIVMVESLQWHRDKGRGPAQAAVAAVKELAGPLAAATGTTLAAFLPLLMSSGDTADFTRAIPIMVMLILVVSYLYAVLVTPTLTTNMLIPGTVRSNSRLESTGHWLGGFVSRRPWLIVGATIVLIVAMGSLGGLMQRDFFPSTDRNQLIVDLNFPEGTRTETTALRAGIIAADLAALDKVTDVHHFAGFSGPRFYYNLIETPRAPHLARIVLISESDQDLPQLLDWIREHVPQRVPEAQVVARRLGQGPPTDAPIEVRLYGPDAEALTNASRKVMSILRQTPGARDVRHRLGDGLPTLVFDIDDAEAARHGVSRQTLSGLLAEATLGREISTWRAGREPLPILIRSPEGEHLPQSALAGIQVDTASGPQPLDLFVRSRVEFQPAVIEHRDLERMTAVLAETDPGVTYGSVWESLGPALDDTSLPPGVRWEAGGAAAEASSANSALFGTLPVGGLVLLAFLIWQFNSLRLVGIVLLTVPLAAAGAIPGLLLAGQPFSFTAMLGVVALIGIVVNNAIVLLDRLEHGRNEGLDMDQAISAAVARRIRPILLTTATTIAGLLPLTFTQSTLWPPMAWAIISGLTVATALTLLLIPAAYCLTAAKSTA